uniref:Uncharacterized protein n=1 Tax=Glossina pallidipes TaxID=7398 RepID=A0A1A9ZJY0_GLOPL
MKVGFIKFLNPFTKILLIIIWTINVGNCLVLHQRQTQQQQFLQQQNDFISQPEEKGAVFVTDWLKKKLCNNLTTINFNSVESTPAIWPTDFSRNVVVSFWIKSYNGTKQTVACNSMQDVYEDDFYYYIWLYKFCKSYISNALLHFACKATDSRAMSELHHNSNITINFKKGAKRRLKSEIRMITAASTTVKASPRAMETTVSLKPLLKRKGPLSYVFAVLGCHVSPSRSCSSVCCMFPYFKNENSTSFALSYTQVSAMGDFLLLMLFIHVYYQKQQQQFEQSQPATPQRHQSRYYQQVHRSTDKGFSYLGDQKSCPQHCGNMHQKLWMPTYHVCAAPVAIPTTASATDDIINSVRASVVVAVISGCNAVIVIAVHVTAVLLAQCAPILRRAVHPTAVYVAHFVHFVVDIRPMYGPYRSEHSDVTKYFKLLTGYAPMYRYLALCQMLPHLLKLHSCERSIKFHQTLCGIVPVVVATKILMSTNEHGKTYNSNPLRIFMFANSIRLARSNHKKRRHRKSCCRSTLNRLSQLPFCNYKNLSTNRSASPSKFTTSVNRIGLLASLPTSNSMRTIYPCATSPIRTLRRLCGSKYNLTWLLISLVWFEGPKLTNCNVIINYQYQSPPPTNSNNNNPKATVATKPDVEFDYKASNLLNSVHNVNITTLTRTANVYNTGSKNTQQICNNYQTHSRVQRALPFSNINLPTSASKLNVLWREHSFPRSKFARTEKLSIDPK